MLLSRLKADCDYFLGAGGRAEKHLWAGNVREQIAKMRELYDALPEKPEWLTMEDIDRYAQRMEPPYEVVVYHHFENGFDERLDYQTLAEAEQAAQKYVAGTIQYVPNGCVYFTSAYLQEYVAKCTYRAKPVEKKATYRNVRGNKSHL